MILNKFSEIAELFKIPRDAKKDNEVVLKDLLDSSFLVILGIKFLLLKLKSKLNFIHFLIENKSCLEN